MTKQSILFWLLFEKRWLISKMGKCLSESPSEPKTPMEGYDLRSPNALLLCLEQHPSIVHLVHTQPRAPAAAGLGISNKVKLCVKCGVTVPAEAVSPGLTTVDFFFSHMLAMRISLECNW